MINLLPLQQQPCKTKIQHIKKIFYLILFILLIIYGFYQYHIILVNQDILKIDSLLAQQTHQASQADTLIAQINQIQEKMTKIHAHQNENAKLYSFLSLLPRIMPQDLYLVNLSWHEHSGIIYGQANNNSRVSEFLQALKNNDYFKEVELIKSDKRHENDGTPPIYFVINFHD